MSLQNFCRNAPFPPVSIHQYSILITYRRAHGLSTLIKIIAKRMRLQILFLPAEFLGMFFRRFHSPMIRGVALLFSFCESCSKKYIGWLRVIKLTLNVTFFSNEIIAFARKITVRYMRLSVYGILTGTPDCVWQRRPSLGNIQAESSDICIWKLVHYIFTFFQRYNRYRY